jgi:hypothetical protein
MCWAASSGSVDFTLIQCTYNVPSSDAFTVRVPGVSVIEFESAVREVRFRRVVLTLTMPGRIGMSGCRTRYATSKFAFTT